MNQSLATSAAALILLSVMCVMTKLGGLTSLYAPSEATSTAKTTKKASGMDEKPMNIVLLYADDWSFSTLGAMGNEYVQTPVLDDLARQGVLFTHACVVTSVCMQSRATL